MRIRDWSSDVCSSDLKSPRALRKCKMQHLIRCVRRFSFCFGIAHPSKTAKDSLAGSGGLRWLMIKGGECVEIGPGNGISALKARRRLAYGGAHARSHSNRKRVVWGKRW